VNDRAARVRRMLCDAAAEFRIIAFVGSEQPWVMPADTAWSAQIAFPLPDFTVRRQLWQTLVRIGGGPMAPPFPLWGVAERVHFTAGQIRQALAQAQQRALIRAQHAPEISADDLSQACRVQSSQKLATLARKITPLYTWGDLILPQDRLELLREICAHA